MVKRPSLPIKQQSRFRGSRLPPSWLRAGLTRWLAQLVLDDLSKRLHFRVAHALHAHSRTPSNFPAKPTRDVLITFNLKSFFKSKFSRMYSKVSSD